MEYNDIIARKREMEEVIGEAIRRFEEDTGLSVADVRVSRTQSFGEADWIYAKTTVYLEAP